ncbi:MAG TPA: potassium channel family protein [Usitatibacter sp.]|nr:potassium channel family protein [Usitatibacter sp.]
MLTILNIFRESRFYTKFVGAIAALVLVHLIGTLGYLYIGGPDARLIDALYMTFITVATIGYGEVFDMADNPGARVFTMFIGFVGIGTTWYLFSTFTAFILETNLSETYRRRRMMRTIAGLDGHYIVCGIGRVGGYVADELLKTDRRFVAIDSSAEAIAAHGERTGHELCLQGDAADDDVLQRAGIERCAGVFAVTGDDSRNLVICMSARALRPSARIVARVHDRRNVEKTRRAGADEIVSPDFTGGMRIASAMLRPHAVNFMDMMLRTGNNLRVEEVVVPDACGERAVSSIPSSREYLLVAIHEKGGRWNFNPAPADRVRAGDCLVAIVTPQGRSAVEASLLRL